MPFITTTDLSNILFTPRSLKTPEEVTTFFLAQGIRKLLIDADGLDDVLAECVSSIPVSAQLTVQPQAQYFGRNLGDYSGLSRAKIAELYGLTGPEIDIVYAALGVVE
jgi:hypothetical protein